MQKKTEEASSLANPFFWLKALYLILSFILVVILAFIVIFKNRLGKKWDEVNNRLSRG